MRRPELEIPAKYGNCGRVFPSGYGIYTDTGAEFTMKGFENSPVNDPCPKCHKRMGRVLEGEFHFAKDAITLLSGPDSTVKHLERLGAIFLDARDSDANLDEILERA